MSERPAPIVLRLPCGLALPGEGPLEMAVEIHAPLTEAIEDPPVALVCLPGGNMHRRYWDLGGEDDSYSFARQMTARGFVVVAIDSLGIGDSDRPADGWALDTARLAAANAELTAVVLAGLRAGTLTPSIPALPGLSSIGVGHSMGAMMTVVQQAAARQHAAIALLGFSTRGLPEYLGPEAAAMDEATRREALPRLARALFREPYPVIGRSTAGSGFFAGARADPRAAEIIRPAMGNMLALPAFQSMLPGNVAVEAAQIDVPVYLALGALDIAGPPHEIPAAFSASGEVTLLVLPDTGHSHFLFASRARLFAHLARWARGATQAAG